MWRSNGEDGSKKKVKKANMMTVIRVIKGNKIGLLRLCFSFSWWLSWCRHFDEQLPTITTTSLLLRLHFTTLTRCPPIFSAGASYENTLVEVRVWIMLDYLRSTLRIGANHVSEMKSGRREYGAGGTYTTDPSSIYLVRRPKCFVVLTDNQWRTELWRWMRRDCSRNIKKPV